MSEEDMMDWIRENYQTYAYRHLLGLLTQTLASVINNKKLKDATQMLDALYEVDNTAGGSNSLSGTAQAQAKNMLNASASVMSNMSSGVMSGMSGMMSVIGNKQKK